jgi:hypothetical protein
MSKDSTQRTERKKKQSATTLRTWLEYCYGFILLVAVIYLSQL